VSSGAVYLLIAAVVPPLVLLIAWAVGEYVYPKNKR
jgi:hypothetical protein